ncbi:MAG: glycosyltransferase family 4 protein [Anaerolineae bacterium]|nr:glycosyltransferase family 4 protein [Anaerolineae bacterium]
MRSLTIAIDASRTTTARRTGTENYALQLIRALLALDTPHQFRLYFRDTPPPDLFPDQPHVIRRVIPWARVWTHTRFAWALRQDRPDVTFVPAHTLPVWLPGPAVVTVHDLGYVYFPEAHLPFARRYLAWSTRYSVRRASRIIADSLATAKDVAAHYGANSNKITVIYPGVDESLAPVTNPAALAAVRQKYGLPARYLLFLGTLQPRKNIARIVQAYAQWQQASAGIYADVALVLAGQQGWLYDPHWTSGVEGVILPGYVDDQDVAALYSGALALLFPTLHEGFGFPVLEAMRCGTPVITSTTSSLPEVAGDAALLVNARQTDEIAAAIARVVSDDTLRANLIAKGHQQTTSFTWAQAAQHTLNVLLSAATQTSIPH